MRGRARRVHERGGRSVLSAARTFHAMDLAVLAHPAPRLRVQIPVILAAQRDLGAAKR
jgi:hypothetical protein